jgi:hypothetical protein
MASFSLLCNYARRSIGFGLRRLPFPSLHIQEMAIQRGYANGMEAMISKVSQI